MSSFIEHVKAKLTGQRVAIPPELKIVEDIKDCWPDTAHLQYDIGVEWKVRTHCKPEDLQSVASNVVRQLREDVYGEFRQKVLLAQRSFYERDMRTLEQHLRDLLRMIQGENV